MRWLAQVVFLKRSFCGGEVGSGSSGLNAICSQPEVADDIFCGDDVETFRAYACVNLLTSTVRENQNQIFM